MKQSRRCPKCSSGRIGYLATLPDYSQVSHVRPRTIGQTRFELDGLFGAEMVEHEVEAYLCADCGYLETYIKTPAAVPFEEIEGFCWVNTDGPTTAGPYR